MTIDSFNPVGQQLHNPLVQSPAIILAGGILAERQMKSSMIDLISDSSFMYYILVNDNFCPHRVHVPLSAPLSMS